jgi:chromosome partitioning protein
MSIKIAITYEKGGVAKTTTAVNVSAILAERGYKVLLVDLDHQSYATSYYGLYDDTKPGIFELMQGIVSANQVIRSTDFKGLDLLPSTYAFRNMETALMMKVRRQEYTLQNALQSIEDNYDFIFLDCPPSGDRVKTNALAFADYVILPTIPDDYAIHGLQCMAETIVDIKQGVNQKLSVLGVLITIDEHTINKMAYKAALQSQTIFPCFKTAIRKNTKLSEAINSHQPINVYEPKSNGNIDYNSLVNELLEKTGSTSDIKEAEQVG